MGTLAGGGVAVTLPAGWEGRIFTRDPDPIPRELRPNAATTTTTTGVVAHIANFALPEEMGDFGSGAVDLMSGPDLLVVLFEYGSESIGTALFAAQGLPTLRAEDFSPHTLRKLLEGQSGVQRFFTLSGRAFCLYVVLGSHLRRVRTTPVVNEVVRSITVG
jgi:hypothetical protein